ncbi:hypothetical protein BCR39DRAFT_596906 [Naematelia encephala]|uniref:Uncharacterized protein n=1 Tax=Naematelia encephala TaxID=71784 RepID=A0A1Y2BHZ5_9TREE|nr:hypothetical protein BCR39DRAFT_596906 [Naematelia encephala]
MPLQSRRPNLPALSLAIAKRTASDSLHTPNPFTQVPFVDVSLAPLVMTPDTPSFPSIDERAQNAGDDAWTEDEEGILQSYLSAPPRTYPPGSLPPASVLDKMTSELIARPGWQHAWTQTRARLFLIARQETMGHAQHPAGGITRPKLAVLGGRGMSRQMHSMDSLYGDDDEEAGGFGEALRLSGDLQTTAASTPDSILTSGSGLSSPLSFTFNFHPQLPSIGKAKPAFPFPGLPRPTSLLQRGRSFTSADVPAELRGHSRTDSHDSTGSVSTLGEQDGGSQMMRRSATSPVSGFTSSPPSSCSGSTASSDEEGGSTEPGRGVEEEGEEEEDPFTPVNPTFPSSILGLGLNTRSTPSITLTLESPPESASAALARLSLVPGPGPIPQPQVPRRNQLPALGRSLSDTLTMSSARPLLFGDAREPKRQRALKVLVPRGVLGGGEGELRSPFEHKPVPSIS